MEADRYWSGTKGGTEHTYFVDGFDKAQEKIIDEIDKLLTTIKYTNDKGLILREINKLKEKLG